MLPVRAGIATTGVGRLASPPRPPFAADGSAPRVDQYQTPTTAATSSATGTSQSHGRRRGCDASLRAGGALVAGRSIVAGGGASLGVIWLSCQPRTQVILPPIWGYVRVL